VAVKPVEKWWGILSPWKKDPKGRGETGVQCDDEEMREANSQVKKQIR